MRSLFRSIVAWCLAALLLSSFAFYVIFSIFQTRALKYLHTNLDAFVLQQGIQTYEEKGSEGLKAFLRTADNLLQGELHVTDASGKDLITGQDLEELLNSGIDYLGRPKKKGDNIATVATSPDGHYHLVGTRRAAASNFAIVIAYYGVVLLTVVLLCAFFARGIVSPLKRLIDAVEHFGRGSLSIRADCTRRDEIGELARTFNAMADRIEGLLAAERRLLQDISHELRSPLARLAYGAELLRVSEDRTVASDRIKKDVNRLAELVDGLTKIVTADEAREVGASLGSVSLSDICRDVASDCAIEAEARGCSIQTGLWPQGDIEANPELLRRAIENILRNAVRYTAPGTGVNFSVDVVGREAVVTVRDYGAGVSPEALPHIFDPFFRADKARQKSTGGLGLGLSIARRSVQTLGGKLIAENANPGLRVCIFLPILESPATR